MYDRPKIGQLEHSNRLPQRNPRGPTTIIDLRCCEPVDFMYMRPCTTHYEVRDKSFYAAA